MKNFFIIFLCLLGGCATADLRSGRPVGDFSIDDQNKGREILKQVALKGGYDPSNNYTQLDVTLIDHWPLTILRLLTPLRSNHQKLHFIFGLKEIDVLMSYLDGPGAGDALGIKDGKVFETTQGRTVYKNSDSIEVYCLHVRRYFLWPYVLAKMPVVAFLGEGKKFGLSYDLVFTGLSTKKANHQEDQYVLWVNQQTHQVDFIEFTFRHFLNSYKGIVSYQDYRDAQGISFAYNITLLDSFKRQEYLHQLLVQSIKLK